MSRIAYLDCVSGASGDMVLGAMVDLGMPLDMLRAELAKLAVSGFDLTSHRVHRAGMHATKVDVVVPHAHGHPHRNLTAILDILETSGLDDPIKVKAAALFRRLAEAEAEAHGTSVEQVHFHEVGAIDAIVDIVGGVLGFAWLRAERVVASPLNVGTGTVQGSHGTFPVPAPATARLLKGIPVYGEGEGELLTPTGALLVTGHATEYGPLPPLRLRALGHGAGTREIPGRSNILRILVGEAISAASEDERVVVLEAEVDDMSPQLCDPVSERLFAAGALDVYFTPVQMKKGRPGLLITAIAPCDRREPLEEVLFSETTTLGVRRQECQRTKLERDSVSVETEYGPLRVKVGRREGRVYNAQPEFDDCRAAATSRGVPVKEVWAAALAAFRSGGHR